MAGPREGWVLSPGKVLTRRQERRAAPTPQERAGEQLNISAPFIYFPSPPRRHRKWDGGRGALRDLVKGLAVVVAPLERQAPGSSARQANRGSSEMNIKYDFKCLNEKAIKINAGKTINEWDNKFGCIMLAMLTQCSQMPPY